MTLKLSYRRLRHGVFKHDDDVKKEAEDHNLGDHTPATLQVTVSL